MSTSSPEEELAQIRRVSHRVAQTSAEALPGIASKLLPRLLTKLDTTTVARQQIVQICVDIQKRTYELPVVEILQLSLQTHLSKTTALVLVSEGLKNTKCDYENALSLLVDLWNKETQIIDTKPNVRGRIVASLCRIFSLHSPTKMIPHSRGLFDLWRAILLSGTTTNQSPPPGVSVFQAEYLGGLGTVALAFRIQQEWLPLYEDRSAATVLWGLSTSNQRLIQRAKQGLQEALPKLPLGDGSNVVAQELLASILGQARAEKYYRSKMGLSYVIHGDSLLLTTDDSLDQATSSPSKEVQRILFSTHCRPLSAVDESLFSILELANCPPDLLLAVLENFKTQRAAIRVLVSLVQKQSLSSDLVRQARDIAVGLLSSSSEPLRVEAYGILTALKLPDTATILFRSIPKESNHLVTAVAALDAVLGDYEKHLPEADEIKPLWPVVWNAAAQSNRACKVAAKDWAERVLFKVDPLQACHILCFLGDVEKLASDEDSFEEIPFDDLIQTLFQPSTSSKVYGFDDFSGSSQASTLSFAGNCLDADLYGGSDASILVYLQALITSLKDQNYLELLEAAAPCLFRLFQTSEFARGRILDLWDLEGIERLALQAPSVLVRQSMAAAAGCLYELVDDDRPLCSALATCRDRNGPWLGAYAVKALRVRGGPDPLWADASRILEWMADGLDHTDPGYTNICADALLVAFSNEDKQYLKEEHLQNACRIVLTRLGQAIRKYGHGDLVDPFLTLKLAEATGACMAMTSSSAATRPALGKVFDLLGSAAWRKQEEIGIRVGEALARYANITAVAQNMSWPDGPYVEGFSATLSAPECVLYELLRNYSRVSSPQKRTASAQALMGVVAKAAMGVNRDLSFSSRPLPQAILLHMNEIQQTFVRILADSKSKQLVRESCCLGLAACRGLLGRAKKESPDEFTDSLLRAFGQTTNHGGSALMETQEQMAERRLAEQRQGPEMLESFGFEISEVGGASGVGEAALGAYREMASASVSLGRPDILYALLVLSVSHEYWFSGEARQKYNASSLLGEESLLGSKNALEMRKALRPHLVRLLPKLLRACHDPNKETREQMSFLWGGLTGGGPESRDIITKYFDSTLDVLIKEAGSKLWRARCGAIGALSEIIVGRDWNSLGGGSPVLNDDEIADTKNKCAGARLLRLWLVVMRALDDVRGAVRDSGEKLGRCVRALTIRLCDLTTQQTSGSKRNRLGVAALERSSSAAAATALRWLVVHGLHQACNEATGLCMSTLVEIVGLVRPKILEPILPRLLRSLLLAISGLEPAALNYIQLRTDDQEGLERARLQLSQSGPVAEAVSKCMDLVPHLSLKSQQEVVQELNIALRGSVGFASRAATADAVSSLCASSPAAFSYPGVSSNMNPAVQLLRAFYYAADRERGPAAKEKMLFGLGNLAKLCPGYSVRSLALRACRKYNESTGNNHDQHSRRSAAGTLRAIAVRASNHLADGGESNMWCRQVLPVAYVGKRDSDPKIGQWWGEVWSEAGSMVSTGRDGMEGSFGTALEEKLLSFIVKECERAVGDVAWARRVSAAQALFDLCHAGYLAPLSSVNQSQPRRMEYRKSACLTAMFACFKALEKRRLWTGKSKVMEAFTLIASRWASAANECSVFTLATSDCVFSEDGFFSKDREHTQVENEVEVITSKLSFAEVEEASDTSVIDVEISNERIPDAMSIVGLCRFLVQESLLGTRGPNQIVSEELLPYRLSALKGFGNLSQNRGNSAYTKTSILSVWSADLFPVLQAQTARDVEKKEPPVLIAAMLQSWANCFYLGLGTGSPLEADHPQVIIETLFEFGRDNGTWAWTVRQAAGKSVAALVNCCDTRCLCRPKFVDKVFPLANSSSKDRKYWKVRLSGLEILEAVVNRANKETRTLLDALLPYKEEILRMAKESLADSESRVTALASVVIRNMATWP